MRVTRHIGITVLLLALVLSLVCFPARAEETVEALIPVSCSGAPCTAALLDKNGTIELARQNLIPGETAHFAVSCNGLGEFSYILKLTDSDTGLVTYDKSVYKVTVTTYQNEGAPVSYVITAQVAEAPEIVLGDDAGKPSKLEFENFTKNINDGIHECIVSNLRVRKIVSGKPSEPSPFVFLLRPKDSAFPMPSGADKGVARLTIVGAGEATFGAITFSASGTYEYLLTEASDSKKPYRYDGATYLIRFIITENNGVLQEKRVVFKDGVELTEKKAVSALAFTNTYVPSSTPKTGDDSQFTLWRNLALLSLLGLVFVMLLLLSNHRRAKRQNQ